MVANCSAVANFSADAVANHSADLVANFNAEVANHIANSVANPNPDASFSADPVANVSADLAVNVANPSAGTFANLGAELVANLSADPASFSLEKQPLSSEASFDLMFDEIAAEFARPTRKSLPEMSFYHGGDHTVTFGERLPCRQLQRRAS